MPDTAFSIGPVCRDDSCPHTGEHRHDSDGMIWRCTGRATGRLDEIVEFEKRPTSPGG